MANEVKYYQGTLEKFNALLEKDDNALYFITDTKEIYKGSNKISASDAISVAELPEVGSALAGKFYILSSGDTITVNILSPDKSKWLTLLDNTSVSESTLGSVLVADNESFTVELGSGGTLGGFKTGDTVATDTSLENILKKLLMKQVPPTYSQPSIAIANNGGTGSGNIEVGTTVTPNVRATFTQADAGELTGIQFKKNGSNVGTSQSTSPATYTEEPFVLNAVTSFSAVASYSDGPVKDDNLGQPYPTGQIKAGSKTSSNFTFTPYRQGYFYGVLTTSSAEEPLTSDIIRNGSKKNGAYAAGNLPLIQASSVPGRKRIFIACLATNKGVTKVIMPSAMNADATSDFKKVSPVDVEGANGFDAISYNVWVYEPASISDDQTFTVTLG